MRTYVYKYTLLMKGKSLPRSSKQSWMTSPLSSANSVCVAIGECGYRTLIRFILGNSWIRLCLTTAAASMLAKYSEVRENRATPNRVYPKNTGMLPMRKLKTWVVKQPPR